MRRLVRIGYGPYKLGDMKPGDLEEVKLKGFLLQHVSPAWQWTSDQKTKPAHKSFSETSE